MGSYKYFPHTEQDIQKMLEVIGVSSIDELFSDIPDNIKLKEVNLESSYSESELRKLIYSISKKNKELTCFRGCGSLDVYTPSVVDYLATRQEFLTSYTPYQPEISQGTLQYIFEFQSLICELTGLDAANASMYDGASAVAEAIVMACTHTRKNKVLISKTLNPNYLAVIKTYLKYRKLEIIEVDEKNFTYNKEDFLNKVNDEIACCVFQYPNYYGYIEDYDFIDVIRTKKAKFILNCDLSSLAVLRSPKELGADIACGDGQSLGLPKSFGGPYVGYISCVDELLRKIPGRIVGMTTDKMDRRGYVLTLQAREQHIRREKANSNICSNQSLMTLMVVIYSSIMGKTGLIETQERAYQNSHYLKDKLLENPCFTDVNDREFLKEFVLQYQGDANKLNLYLERHGYLGGLALDENKIVFCATEVRSQEEIDEFVRLMGEYKDEKRI